MHFSRITYIFVLNKQLNMGGKKVTKDEKPIKAYILIDPDTGEQVHDPNLSIVRRKSIYIHDEEDFFFVFRQLTLISKDISMTSRKVLEWMAINMTPDENEIKFYKPDQKKCAEYTGLSYNTVRNEVGEMIKSELMKRTNRGVYIVNPKLVWRGSRKNRYEACDKYEKITSKTKETKEK